MNEIIETSFVVCEAACDICRREFMAQAFSNPPRPLDWGLLKQWEAKNQVRCLKNMNSEHEESICEKCWKKIGKLFKKGSL